MQPKPASFGIDMLRSILRSQSCHILEVPESPRAHVDQHRSQRLAVRGQFVFDLRRNFLINLAYHESVPFQLAKLIRKHALRYMAQLEPQLPETLGSFMQQNKQNKGLPFPPL